MRNARLGHLLRVAWSGGCSPGFCPAEADSVDSNCERCSLWAPRGTHGTMQPPQCHCSSPVTQLHGQARARRLRFPSYFPFRRRAKLALLDCGSWLLVFEEQALFPAVSGPVGDPNGFIFVAGDELSVIWAQFSRGIGMKPWILHLVCT